MAKYNAFLIPYSLWPIVELLEGNDMLKAMFRYAMEKKDTEFNDGLEKACFAQYKNYLETGRDKDSKDSELQSLRAYMKNAKDKGDYKALEELNERHEFLTDSTLAEYLDYYGSDYKSKCMRSHASARKEKEEKKEKETILSQENGLEDNGRDCIVGDCIVKPCMPDREEWLSYGRENTSLSVDTLTKEYDRILTAQTHNQNGQSVGNWKEHLKQLDKFYK